MFKNDKVAEMQIKNVDKDNLRCEVITYNKSFTARCALAISRTKFYYRELKGELLSYTGVRSRISWQYDSFSYKREKKAILTIRGNTLTLYLDLDINNINPKYKLNDESSKKSYQDTPVSISITGPRKLAYAKELIAMVFADLEYDKRVVPSNQFNALFYERTLQELLEQNLVKEVVRRMLLKNAIKKQDALSLKLTHRVKIYLVLLTKQDNDLYVTGNVSELGLWDPKKALKLDKVYDNFYKIDLDLPTCNLEFKVVAAKTFDSVEKGIWKEEIANHKYYLDTDLVIEDIVHNFREGD